MSHVVLVCEAVLLSIQWQRSKLDLSLLLEVFPHVSVRFEFRTCVLPKRPFHFQPLQIYRIIPWGRFTVDDSRSRIRLILFLFGRCVERHLKYFLMRVF